MKNQLDRDLSTAKLLCLGRIHSNNLFPFPKIQHSEQETLKLVIETVDKFMQEREQSFRTYDLKGEQPADYLEQLKELGLFGLIIPEEFGGLGFSSAAYSRVLQQTSRYDVSTSLTVGAHSSIGMKGLLLYGNATQKANYLPKLASGEMIAAFCLTEAGSGSDAASIKTKATKNPDGSWILNGEKIWITNGPIADFFTVFARTDTEKGKLSAFIVERAWNGVNTGNKEDKMGIRASATSTVSFDNVIIPPENILGEEGKGFKIAMGILNSGRTGLGGGCIGGLKAFIKHASQQALQRKQFGKSIADFDLIKEKIAQLTINCFAAESVVSMVGHYIDSGFIDYSVEAAISKVFCTEASWNGIYEALQIAGGNGYMREFPYERYTRDARINTIFEGTSEILRLYIALSGLKDAGDYFKDLAKNLGNFFKDPIKGFGVLTEYASIKISQLTPIGREQLNLDIEQLKELSDIYQHSTAQFASCVESILRRYGKDLVDKQLILKRCADTMIDLFVGLCVLSRVHSMIKESGVSACQNEIAIARTFAQQAARRIRFNLRRIDDNEDSALQSISDHIVKLGHFPWDII